jgi:PLP dependent protein
LTEEGAFRYIRPDQVARLRERIATAASRAGRHPEEIDLLAVSKRQSAGAIAEALRLGIACFGENYVAEAEEKQQELTAFAGRWHLIGALQRNKAARAVALFEVIESVDRLALAVALGNHARAAGKRQQVLVEVNLSGADQRAGVLPEEASSLCEQIRNIEGLTLNGLMGIAPIGEESVARASFGQLRKLFERLPRENRRTLSMGMSQDFEIAIEEGATQVRIGTALFGARTEPRG